MKHSSKSVKAFTLLELLAIIAVVALLATARLPALARTRAQTLIAQCSGNLRQFTLVAHIYANDNGDRMPQIIGGGWPWDLSWNVADNLLRNGATRNTMYCPAAPEQNTDGLWNFRPNTYRVIGYEMSFTGAAGVISTNINSTLTPQRLLLGAGVVSPPPLASRRVLVADAIISQPGQTIATNWAAYTYTGIQGGYSAPGWTGHRTAHLAGNLPAGGNLGMLDGHVEWRPFQSAAYAMIPRAIGTGPSPVFWW